MEFRELPYLNMNNITFKFGKKYGEITLTAVSTKFTSSIGSLIQTPFFPCKIYNIINTGLDSYSGHATHWY